MKKRRKKAVTSSKKTPDRNDRDLHRGEPVNIEPQADFAGGKSAAELRQSPVKDWSQDQLIKALRERIWESQDREKMVSHRLELMSVQVADGVVKPGETVYGFNGTGLGVVLECCAVCGPPFDHNGQKIEGRVVVRRMSGDMMVVDTANLYKYVAEAQQAFTRAEDEIKKRRDTGAAKKPPAPHLDAPYPVDGKQPIDTIDTNQNQSEPAFATRSFRDLTPFGARGDAMIEAMMRNVMRQLSVSAPQLMRTLTR